MSAIDLTEKLKPYENKWVAITKDYKKIIATGKTLEETIKKAKKIKAVIYTYVDSFKMGYAPILK